MDYCRAGQRKKVLIAGFSYVADSLYRKAIQLDSNNDWAYFLIGDNYRTEWIMEIKSSILDSARNFYYKAISLNSFMPIYWSMLASTYETEGRVFRYMKSTVVNKEKLEKAIYCYTKAKKLVKDSCDYNYRLAGCYYNIGDTINGNRYLHECSSQKGK